MRTALKAKPQPTPASATPAISVLPDPTTATAPKKPGLNFGSISTKKSSGKKEYPYVPDDPELADIAQNLRSKRQQIEVLDGEIKQEQAALMERVYPFYWESNKGKSGVPSSLNVKAKDGERILVMIAAKYPSPKEAEIEAMRQAIVRVIGQESYDANFRNAFSIKITGDKIPTEHQQDFIDKLGALCAEYNCIDALEAAPTIRPVADFHQKRHVAFTPDQNKALNEVFPITVMVKSKGVD